MDSIPNHIEIIFKSLANWVSCFWDMRFCFAFARWSIHHIYHISYIYINDNVAPSHPRQRVRTTTMPMPMRLRPLVKLNVNCPIAAADPVSRSVRGTRTSRIPAAATQDCIRAPGPNTIYRTMVFAWFAAKSRQWFRTSTRIRVCLVPSSFGRHRMCAIRSVRYR